jgi:hypothetical protein
MSNHSRLHNPSYVGPGTWFSIHSMAAYADTPEKKKCVIDQIKYIQAHFPCGDCKVHFGNYISSHPMEPTLQGGADALFLWTVNFHNAVNFRLNKPQVSYEEARKIFYSDSIYCTAKCDDEPQPPIKNIKLVPRDMPGHMF